MIDQDQSDDGTTQYLLIGNGQTARTTPVNSRPGRATTIGNGSDNALLSLWTPTLGCTRFTSPT